MNRRYQFIYRIGIPDKSPLKYIITLDGKNTNVDFPNKPDSSLDYWKELNFCQCSNCTLSKETNKYCPIAESLLPIILDFGEVHSWEAIKIDVECNRRHYFNKTSVQDALKSLLGLIMASSSCPHFKFLRPLAKMHLPFADHLETIYRITSSYLLSQYLHKDSENIDLSLLKDKYVELTKVNQGIISRIRKLEHEDAGQNAIVDLDTFIQMFSIEYEEMNLDELFGLFELDRSTAYR